MWLCAQQSYVMVGLLIVSKGVEMAGESVVVCVMFRCLGGVKHNDSWPIYLPHLK